MVESLPDSVDFSLGRHGEGPPHAAEEIPA
jgi:hypothetical protein